MFQVYVFLIISYAKKGVIMENISLIHGVHVCKGAYDAGCNFDLFASKGDKPHRASVIFGHNGSGKSTIAKEIEAIKSGQGNGYFYDSDKKPLALEEQERERIRVFDEDYIESRTRIVADGLEAFVMLGEQVKTADKIAKIDDSIATVKRDINDYENTIRELTDGPKSSKSIDGDAKNAAKDGGWASRREKVSGSKKNLSPNRWDDIRKSATEQPREYVEKEFEKKLAEFQKVKDAGSSHLPTLSPVSVAMYDESSLLGLLGKSVNDPVLSDRETRILELAQSGHQSLVETAESTFSQEDVHVCPMCQQEVTQEHKQSVLDSIHMVFNKEVDEFKKELDDAVLRELNPQEAPDQISEECKSRLQRIQEKIIKCIGKYNELLCERRKNIYSPNEIEPLGLADAITTLNEVIASINEEVDFINKAIDSKESIKAELLSLNNKIAWIDARPKIEESDRALKNLQDAKNDCEKKCSELTKLVDEKNRQEAKIRQVDIAIDVINSYLANVYFDSKKFKLVFDENRYKVVSHGRSVRPRDISTGERNILALCYFFSESGKNRKRGNADDDSQYLILDDPVSSFDMENRIGVCSLIRERSEHILKSNDASRITILTHDASVVEELERVFSDINRFAGVNPKFCVDRLLLKNGVMEVSSGNSSEYTALLKRSYDFAASATEDPGESYVIGNVLRRVLEGYSTFNYGIGMDQLSREADLMERLGDRLPFLKDAMYRLAFNDGSHMKEKLNAFSPINAFGRYSYDEKKGCAQCVMVILNSLDSVHVKKILGKSGISQGDLEDNLKRWAERFTPQKSPTSSGQEK